MNRTLFRGWNLPISSAISRIAAEPEPLSLMPEPVPTLSRWAPTAITLSGSPPFGLGGDVLRRVVAGPRAASSTRLLTLRR
jgi:hypothetical protein